MQFDIRSTRMEEMSDPFYNSIRAWCYHFQDGSGYDMYLGITLFGQCMITPSTPPSLGEHVEELFPGT
jgi:hypothetical protein